MLFIELPNQWELKLQMKYPEYIQNRLESLGRREECLQIKLEEWCLKANLIKTTSKAINKELCC